jgi:hypothetical protein
MYFFDLHGPIGGLCPFIIRFVGGGGGLCPGISRFCGSLFSFVIWLDGGAGLCPFVTRFCGGGGGLCPFVSRFGGNLCPFVTWLDGGADLRPFDGGGGGLLGWFVVCDDRIGVIDFGLFIIGFD